MDRHTSGLVIALDVGGTSVKSAIVSENGDLIGGPKRTPVDNQASADAILNTFTAIIQEHRKELHGAQLVGVAFGFPGPLDKEAGISYIRGVEKFDALYKVNLRQGLQQRLGWDDLAILFRNDAEAAIVGEARYGVGRPHTRVIGITLGTGLGSAFLVHGKPVTTGAGVPADGWLYRIPFKETLADEVFSIRGLISAVHEAGIEVDNPKTAADLARQNHQTARTVFKKFGHLLGEFLAPWVAGFQPDILILQGGIANAMDLFEPALSEELPVDILQGKLDTKAAVLGAAALFFDPPD